MRDLIKMLFWFGVALAAFFFAYNLGMVVSFALGNRSEFLTYILPNNIAFASLGLLIISFVLLKKINKKTASKR